MSSAVEDPPLIFIPWAHVLDSQQVVVAADVFMESNRSVELLLSSDLEPFGISFGVSRILRTNLIKFPLLVGVEGASPENEVSVMSIRTTMNVQAFISVVLQIEVSFRAFVPLDSFSVVICVRSNYSSVSNVESVAELIGNNVVSHTMCSDCVSSRVMHEPLFVVFWVISSDSQSVLVGSDVLMDEDCSVGVHH